MHPVLVYLSGFSRSFDSIRPSENCFNLVQGYYRAAKAAMKLGEYQQAIPVIERGLAADASQPEFQKMLATAKQKAQDMAAVRRREALKALAERAPAKQLAADLLKRQYKIGRPQLSLGQPLLISHNCPVLPIYDLDWHQWPSFSSGHLQSDHAASHLRLPPKLSKSVSKSTRICGYIIQSPTTSPLC